MKGQYNTAVSQHLKSNTGIEGIEEARVRTDKILRETQARAVKSLELRSKRAEYDTQFDNFEKFPGYRNFAWWNVLLSSVENAPKDIDISDLTVKLPAMRRRVYAEFITAFEAKIGSMRELKPLLVELEKAKRSGVDVSDIEGSIPEIRRNVCRARISRIREKPNYRSNSEISALIVQLNEAKEAGIDTSEFEAEIPELRSLVCGQLIADFEAKPLEWTSSDLDKITETMNSAKKLEVDIAVHEAKIPQLRRILCETLVIQIEGGYQWQKNEKKIDDGVISEYDIDTAIRSIVSAGWDEMNLQNQLKVIGDFGMGRINELVEALNKAKIAGADIADIETKIPQMRRNVCENMINHFKNVIVLRYQLGDMRSRTTVHVDRIVEFLGAAKAAGADVADLEAEIPDMRRDVCTEVIRSLSLTVAAEKAIAEKHSKTISAEKIERSRNKIMNHINEAFEKAKAAGVDISEFEWKLAGMIR